MKIGLISENGEPVLAAAYGERYVSVSRALEALGKEPVNELKAFIRLYGDSVVALNEQIHALVLSGKADEYVRPLEGAVYLPPIPAQPKLFTARGNSAVFTRVNRSPICKQPVLEQRYGFNLVGHNSVFTIPENFKVSGWNYEMICVMAKPCRNATTSDAYDFVFGYTNMLDHSGRCTDYPYAEGNKWAMPNEDKIFSDWAYEGCYNGNTQVPTPIGPFIVTRDEVGDPHDQLLEERESRRLVSLGSGKAVCFTFNEIISYLSSFMTLDAGDMVNTASITYDGYPNWAGRYPEYAYIQATAEKLGTLRLNIRDERKDI